MALKTSSISRPSNSAFIGLGTNLGDRPANLKLAIDKLTRARGIKLENISNIYETKPIFSPARLARREAERAGGGNIRRFLEVPPYYLNAVVEIRTSLPPHELMATLLDIEKSMGRPYPHPKDEPRTIDLDILLYDNSEIDTPGLKIPHPRLAKRLFVLVPLCDIAPDIRHPKLGASMREIMLCLSTDTKDPDDMVRKYL